MLPAALRYVPVTNSEQELHKSAFILQQSNTLRQAFSLRHVLQMHAQMV